MMKPRNCHKEQRPKKNQKFRSFLLTCLALGFVLTAGITAASKTDPFPTIVLPVYTGGYDVETSFNRLKGIKWIGYRVQTQYPAAEVIEYYDIVLNGRGWKPSFEICQRHWASPDDGSIKKEFRARQLFTSWDHPRHKLRISLLLEYKPPGGNRRDEVAIECRLQPLLDNSRYDDFISRLKEAGQYPEFIKRLEAYRKPGGEVDSALIARDIHNNRADDILIEYWQIKDEQKNEIADIIRRVNQDRRGS